MADDASSPVATPVYLVSDGSEYDGTFYVGDFSDGKLLTSEKYGDLDAFFVLISGYLVRLQPNI